MKKKKSYKTWEQSKIDIEKTLNSPQCDANDNDICLTYGIQLKQTLSHFPSPIFSAVYRDGAKKHLEYYAVNYVSSDTGESFVVQWRYDPVEGSSKMIKKVLIRQCLKILIFLPLQHAFVGYCTDMTIRGYSGVNFEEKSRLSVSNTVICMIYLDDFDELITAGQGYVCSWNMRIIEFGLLCDPKQPTLYSEVNASREWVQRLFYDKQTKTIMALTDNSVYVISMVTRRQIEVFHNTHKASLTGCTFFRPYFYFITAARDGSIHVYHTGVQALVRTFPAQRDGITGVLSLPQLPILISWSHKSGGIRMWRLDTLELTNEITLSESIQFLQLARDDRLFYFSETEVRIFSVNVLYSVFATLSSPAETFRTCHIRRVCNREVFLSKPSTTAVSAADILHASAAGSENSPDSFDKRRSDTSNMAALTDSRHSALDQKALRMPKNPMHVYGPSVPEKQSSSTFPDFAHSDHRLICVLDDRCIMGISPVTGLVLNIVYPHLEVDKPCVAVDMSNSGKGYYTVLSDGKFIEFDCSVNPGQLTNVIKPSKNVPKVCSVAAMEVYIDEGSRRGMRRQGIFVGLDSGFIKLYDGGDLKGYTKREIGPGGRRLCYLGTSSINELGPILTMAMSRAHYGKVIHLHAPHEDSLKVDEKEFAGVRVQNILLTCGSDNNVGIWKVSALAGSTPLKLEVLFHKMRFIKFDFPPTCLAVTSNVAIFGFLNGQVEMCQFQWKVFVSQIGAQIKLECNSIVLHSAQKISVGQELFHKAVVTSASASHLLQLFVTTSNDNCMKIWDCEGQMVRKLILGDIVRCVCFSNGRDLLASLRNHIVHIEAHRYLPSHYLYKILDIAKEQGIVELEPEEPKTMEGGHSEIFFASRPEERDESEISSATILHRQMEEETPEEMKKMNVILKYLKKKRTFYAQAMKAISVVSEAKIAVAGITLKEFAPIVRIQDKAQNFILKLDLEKMSKYPIGPDGYIPNSVIRSIIKSVYPSFEVFKNALAQNEDKTSMVTDQKTSKKSIDWVSSHDDVQHFHWDDSETESMDEEIYENNIVHRLDLSNQQKLEMKRLVKSIRDSRFEVVVKEPPKTRRKSSVAQPPEVKVKEKVGVKEEPKISRDKLVILLEELCRQRWCPNIITVQTFQQGMSAIARVLVAAGSKICHEICRFLCLLFDACHDAQSTQDYSRMFSLQVQKLFTTRLSELLSHPFPNVQQAAVEILCRFDNNILQEILLKNVMPLFIQRKQPEDAPTLHSDPAKIAYAAKLVKNFTNHIDVGRLYTLSHLIQLDSYRSQQEEDTAFVAGLSKALVSNGVDIIEAPVWAMFVLPVLLKEKQDAAVALAEKQIAAQEQAEKERQEQEALDKSEEESAGSRHTVFSIATAFTLKQVAVSKLKKKKIRKSEDEIASPVIPKPPSIHKLRERLPSSTPATPKHSAVDMPVKSTSVQEFEEPDVTSASLPSFPISITVTDITEKSSSPDFYSAKSSSHSSALKNEALQLVRLKRRSSSRLKDLSDSRSTFGKIKPMSSQDLRELKLRASSTEKAAVKLGSLVTSKPVRKFSTSTKLQFLQENEVFSTVSEPLLPAPEDSAKRKIRERAFSAYAKLISRETAGILKKKSSDILKKKSSGILKKKSSGSISSVEKQNEIVANPSEFTSFMQSEIANINAVEQIRAESKTTELSFHDETASLTKTDVFPSTSSSGYARSSNRDSSFMQISDHPSVSTIILQDLPEQESRHDSSAISHRQVEPLHYLQRTSITVTMPSVEQFSEKEMPLSSVKMISSHKDLVQEDSVQEDLQHFLPISMPSSSEVNTAATEPVPIPRRISENWRHQTLREGKAVTSNATVLDLVSDWPLSPSSQDLQQEPSREESFTERPSRRSLSEKFYDVDGLQEQSSIDIAYQKSLHDMDDVQEMHFLKKRGSSSRSSYKILPPDEDWRAILASLYHIRRSEETALARGDISKNRRISLDSQMKQPLPPKLSLPRSPMKTSVSKHEGDAPVLMQHPYKKAFVVQGKSDDVARNVKQIDSVALMKQINRYQKSKKLAKRRSVHGMQTHQDKPADTFKWEKPMKPIMVNYLPNLL